MVKIRYKLTGLFILLVVIASSLVALFVLWRIRVEVEKEVIQKMQNQAKYLVAGLQMELNQVKNTALTVEASVYSSFPNEGLNASNIDKFKTDLASSLQQVGEIMQPLSMWFVLNTNLVKGEHVVSFFDQNRDGSFVQEEEYDIYDMDLSGPDMKWWTEAVEYGEVWTEPYYWDNWGMELISYSKAIYVDSVFIGCLGSDFDFSIKREEWSSIKINESGYVVLVNKDFKFIVHPHYNNELAKDVIPSEVQMLIEEAVSASESGYLKYNLFDQEKILVYQKLSNDWGMFVVVPTHEIYAPINRLVRAVLFISISVILLSVLVAFLFSNSISYPIRRLVGLFNKAADGDLSVRSVVKTNDEIEELGNRFNFFMTEMQRMVLALKDQEKKLIAEKNRAEESDKLKTAFLSNLSHEIRTPLNAIVGYSELMIESDLTTEEKKNYMEVVQVNNDKLTKFIEDIITYSELEQGQITPDKKEVVLGDLPNKIEQEFGQIYTNKKAGVLIGFRNENLDESKVVEVDLLLLFKALHVLMDNALKYTEKGSIVLVTYMKDNVWGVYVKDSGIGIPKEYQELIFNKFYKYMPGSSVMYNGVGMGLPIAYDLVKLIGGSISVESDSGEGACFKIAFSL